MKFSYEKFLEAAKGHPYLCVQISPYDVTEFLQELDNHPLFLWAGEDKPSAFSPLKTDLWKRISKEGQEPDIYFQIKLGGYLVGLSNWAITWGTLTNLCGGEVLNHLVSVYDLLDDVAAPSLDDIDIANLL